MGGGTLRSVALATIICASMTGMAEANDGKGASDTRGLTQQVGTASWYGPGFHGRKTASGDRFNQNAMTAAHRRLPLGTVVEVTNLENGRKVVVEINDRGPYIRGRVIDLSKGAARRIGMVDDGVVKVKVEVKPENEPEYAEEVTGDGRSVPTF